MDESMIVILGPTASGKTKLAARLANILDGEIISADSRQVYKGMNIGTGKDLNEYTFEGKNIPYHLIDIVNAGVKYNINDFQKDVTRALSRINDLNKIPIIVGGAGLYLEAILQSYLYTSVPVNTILRNRLDDLDLEKLRTELNSINNRVLSFDCSTSKRLIRAIEICHYLKSNQLEKVGAVIKDYTLFGIKLPRTILLQRIEERLKFRLEHGMIEEVAMLLDSGIPSDRLKYYGLEYKFVTLHLEGQLYYDELFEKLNIAIRQFAKRQMTWFRKMERSGYKIHWVDGTLPVQEQLSTIELKLDIDQ